MTTILSFPMNRMTTVLSFPMNRMTTSSQPVVPRFPVVARFIELCLVNQASTMRLWPLGDIRLTIGQYDDRTIRLIELPTHLTTMFWPWTQCGVKPCIANSHMPKGKSLTECFCGSVRTVLRKCSIQTAAVVVRISKEESGNHRLV